MKIIFITAALLLSLFTLHAQDTLKTDTAKVKPDTAIKKAPAIARIKTNPIIFYEWNFGAGLSGVKGIMFGSDLNYQFKNNFFTLRITGIADLDFGIVSPIAPVPTITDNGSLVETGLLYGYRSADDGSSVSASAGISYNERILKYNDAQNLTQRVHKNYIGFPFEFNILWYKKAKRRFHIYHVIPVGKPTGFGASIGFKLSGNISAHSYAALGIVYGLGYHKHF